MNTKLFSEAMSEVNDKYYEEAASYEHKRKKYHYGKEGETRKNMKKITIRIMAACATFVLMFFTAINIWAPVYARTIPLLGNVFAFMQDKLDVAGLYSNYAFQIGDSAVDNGITITLSEMYCDGTNLYAGFVIESEKSFSEISPDDYNINMQLDYAGDSYISSGADRMILDDSGVTGFEGEFVDEYTFVGIETYSLDGFDFPSEFAFEMKIDWIGAMHTRGIIGTPVNGNWIFSVLVKSNTDDVVTYEINKEVNGHTIDKIVVTPIMITVYTSYPNLYSGTNRYQVKAFSDLSPDEDITHHGRSDATTAINQIPRNRVDHNLCIYVLDYDQLCKTGAERGSREEIVEHAIVWAEIFID